MPPAAPTKRIFGLKQSGFVTIDPTDFSVTNTFTYAAMKKLETSKKDPEEFTFSCGSAMTFRTQYRSHLLTELVRLRAMTVDETALGLVSRIGAWACSLIAAQC